MDSTLTCCLEFFCKRRVNAHLVGGTVRDQLLGRDSHDLDFVVPQEALPLARELADTLGGAFYPLDAERETARIVMPD
ncbi:MAG: polynucleotide adenylyltransferase, partial [Chloroflexi bacterium]|nr:polynucleotide adenylyltransferase [Chloroflexota bacterium]